MANQGDVWAQLVSLESSEDIVEISGDTFTIGRAAENDLSFVDNKLVSQNHCKITSEDGGNIYITDSSTNGTQVDGTKVKQRKAELHHGDEIHIVFKKNNVQNNIAYTFEQLSKKLADTLEATQEYEPSECTTPKALDSDAPPLKVMKMSNDSELPKDGGVKGGIDEPDEIEETLLCSICQELLHDCVSLQPCMHTFCGGCFSRWMKSSSSCPTCRKRAISVAQNHILRNLIDIYLKSNPGKRRSDADIEELNKHNVIKTLNMKLKDTGGFDYDEDDYSGSSNSDDSDVDSDPTMLGLPFHIPAAMNASIPVCRQCPGYDASRARFGLPVASASPSADGTSTDSTTAAGTAAGTAATYVCPQGTQRHIVCYCCMEMFPDRRLTPGTPPVSCEVCSGNFCHLYWQCKKLGCRGCLSKLKDMDFEDSVLDNLLLQNSAESTVLKEYMQTKSVTLREVVTDTCTKVDRGEFQLNNDFGCNFLGRNLKGDSIICHKCGIKALRQLAYLYRKSIPATDLPDAVTEKEDCYWGKNCRTQKKPGHAARWNHICEQTRFAN